MKTIIIIILLMLFVGLYWAFYILYKNNKVYNFRIMILQVDLDYYKLLPPYDEMLYNFKKPTLKNYFTNKQIEEINKMLGAKVSNKILIIENLLERAIDIIIGVGMAYTFMKVHCGKIGNSLLKKLKIMKLKEIVSIVLLFIVPILTWFLLTSFCFMSFNVTKWNVLGRFLFVIVCLISSFFCLVILGKYESNKIDKSYRKKVL